MQMKIKQAPWLALAIAVVLLLLYGPAFKLLARQWWADPDYQHGLIAPFVIGLMLWMGRAAWRKEPLRPARLTGGAVIALALLLLYAGARGPIHFAQYTSLILMSLGLTLYMGGYGFLRYMFAPLAILALAVPLPTVVLNMISAPLQLFASQCAVFGMQAFDISLVREGNVIEMLPRGAIKPYKLEVVQACSGVRSLMSLVTMAFMLAYFTYPRAKAGPGGGGPPWWRQYGFWRSAVLVVAALPIAVLTNAFRVSGTGILSYYYGIEAAEGFFHSFSGAVTYTTAAVLLLALAWLLDRARRRSSGIVAGRRGAGAELSSSKVSKLA